MIHYRFPPSGGGRWVVDESLALIADGIIEPSTDGLQLWRAGAITPIALNLLPFGIDPPADGTVIRVEGTDDINTITIANNDVIQGCLLFGNWVGKKGYILEVMYVDADKRFIEIARNS